MGSSSVGSRWIIIIMIYFIFMSIVVASVTELQNNTLYEESSQNFCTSPRALYEPYNNQIIGFSNDYRITYGQKESHIDCSKSQGVLDQTTCESINGCSWDSTTSGWWWWKTENEPTCIGNINASSYNIDTFNYFWGGYLVAEHENTPNNWGGTGMGSICTHPEVINNRDMCNAFSCSWNVEQGYNPDLLYEIDPSARPRSLLRQAWNSIFQMFTFQHDFGIENNFIAQLLILFLFWIPFIILLFAIVQIVMQSTWT